MTSRVMIALIWLNVATVIGTLIAGDRPASCEGSENFLCGTALATFVDDTGSLSSITIRARKRSDIGVYLPRNRASTLPI